MTSPNGLNLLKASEVAEILRIKPWTVTVMCRNGELRATRVGKSWRIEEAAVRDYLDREEEKARRARTQDA